MIPHAKYVHHTYQMIILIQIVTETETEIEIEIY